MIHDMTWGAPNYWYVFILFFMLVGILCYQLHKKRRVVIALAGVWASTLIRNFSVSRAVVKIVLSSLGILFLCIALLRPQGKVIEDKIAQQGRDVYFALDVSRSMLAADVTPDRLTRAKEKIKQTIASLSCERVGLILFSGAAYVQCPLTADMTAFISFLNQVDVETISSGTTALDRALLKALDAFEHMRAKKNKLLVLLTDGEDFSTSLTDVKRRAQEQGLHIFAWGVGTAEGAPIPLIDSEGNSVGHQRDENGAIVISQLNENVLRSLVKDVGGDYIRLTTDDGDVRSLVKKVQSFEKEEFDDTVVKRFDEKYPYFVLVSFICFLIEWLL